MDVDGVLNFVNSHLLLGESGLPSITIDDSKKIYYLRLFHWEIRPTGAALLQKDRVPFGVFMP
jgi:hypothetical protein